MSANKATRFVAECFWPAVRKADLEALDRRVALVTAKFDPPTVRYLGSLLLHDDEVVLCQFEGTAEAVRDVAKRARVPFERILAASHSPFAAGATAPLLRAGHRPIS